MLSWPGLSWLVPAISLRSAQPSVPCRDCRDKSGNDNWGRWVPARRACYFVVINKRTGVEPLRWPNLRVLPALVAATHVLRRHSKQGVGGRDKPGHDSERMSGGADAERLPSKVTERIRLSSMKTVRASLRDL